jgi:hypothetical protein
MQDGRAKLVAERFGHCLQDAVDLLAAQVGGLSGRYV